MSTSTCSTPPARSSPRATNDNIATQAARADRRPSPTRAATSSRSRSSPGPIPGTSSSSSSANSRQRHHRLPAVRHRGRHVLPDLGRAHSAADHHRRRRDSLVGSRPYLGQTRCAPSRSARPGPSIIVRNPDGSLLTPAQTVQNPTVTAPGRRQHLVLRAGRHRHQQPSVPRPAGDLHRTSRRTCPASSAPRRRPPTPRPWRPSCCRRCPSSPRPRSGRADRLGRRPMNASDAGHMGPAGRLRPGQRHQGDQRRRRAPRALDRPGQRLDGDGDSQRHHGDLQQAGRFLDGHHAATWSSRPRPRA